MDCNWVENGQKGKLDRMRLSRGVAGMNWDRLGWVPDSTRRIACLTRAWDVQYFLFPLMCSSPCTVPQHTIVSYPVPRVIVPLSITTQFARLIRAHRTGR